MQDYLRWFLRRFWIFLIGITGGFFLGLYLYSITPPSYMSMATIEILRVKRDAADIAEAEKIRMTGAAEMLSASERLRLPLYYTEPRRTRSSRTARMWFGRSAFSLEHGIQDSRLRVESGSPRIDDFKLGQGPVAHRHRPARPHCDPQ